MNLWKNMKFHLKLMIIFSSLLILFVIGFILVFFQVENVNHQQEMLKSKSEMNFSAMELGTLINNKYIAIQDAIRTGRFSTEENEMDTQLMDETLEMLRSNITTQEQEELLVEVIDNKDEYNQLVEHLRQAPPPRTDEEELERISQLGRLDQLRRLFIRNIQEISNMSGEEMKYATSQVETAVLMTKYILGIALISSVVIGGILIVIFSRSITRQLNEMLKVAEAVSKGNLTVNSLNNLKLKTKDEIGELRTAFGIAVDNLRNLVSKISDNSEQMAAATEELSASIAETGKSSEHIVASAQQVASGAEMQLQSANEADKAASEIKESMIKMNDNIRTVFASSKNMLQKAESGNEVIEETVNQMNLIGEKSETTSELIIELGNKSKEINHIVNMITTIADQTNLLALNAAIEAARAGDHGKGFAVVANEVRMLAEQSRAAADQIGELINNIHADIQKSVHSMEEERVAVKDGVELVGLAGKTFADITNAVNLVTREVESVKNLTEIVSEGVAVLAKTINETRTIAEEAAGATHRAVASAENQNASIEEILSAANTLTSIAEDLRKDVSNFNL